MNITKEATSKHKTQQSAHGPYIISINKSSFLYVYHCAVSVDIIPPVSSELRHLLLV